MHATFATRNQQHTMLPVSAAYVTGTWISERDSKPAPGRRT